MGARNPRNAWWPREGWTLVMVHNYGGHRRTQYKRDHIRAHLVGMKAHNMVLQEHDPRTILRPSDHENFWILEDVDADINNPECTGLAIMARKHHSPDSEKTDLRGRACIRRCPACLESRRVVVQKKGPCVTPATVVEVELPHGAPLRILNTHFHHMTAKKAKGHSDGHRDVLQMYADMILRHGVHLLMGDFNQAAPHMVQEFQPLLGRVRIHADSHHPTFEDCMCIFSLGEPRPPGRDSEFKEWEPRNAAHRPLARNYGCKPKRTAVNDKARRQRAHERWMQSWRRRYNQPLPWPKTKESQTGPAAGGGASGAVGGQAKTEGDNVTTMTRRPLGGVPAKRETNTGRGRAASFLSRWHMKMNGGDSLPAEWHMKMLNR